MLPELLAKYQTFTPSTEEQKFLTKNYTDFEVDRQLKEEGQPNLSNRSLQTFWNDSDKDYLQYLLEDSDDWMKEYPSGMTRDKANIFISNLIRKPIIAQVFAQNKNQMVDRIVSKTLKGLLEYAILNDGRPDSSGHEKQARVTHKQVTEGTCHKLITINEDKDIETEVMPNEEIFIPTFFQPNLQKLSHFMRVQQNVDYEEAKMEFGSLDRFKSVVPGSEWMYSNPSMKASQGRTKTNKVTIIRCWYPVPKNKLPNGVKRQKYYNVIIQGIPMFPVENKDIFRHGYFPIVKYIFEILDEGYYWGNSIGNKMRFDKKFASALRTLIIAAEKLDIMPPQVAEEGLTVDADMYVPGKTTSITGKAEQIKRLMERRPVTQGDVALLDMISKSGDEASASPVSGGQPSRESKTLGEVQLQEANAAKLMESFGLMTAFGVEREAYLILKTLIQFYPRKKIDELSRISVPNQSLSNGRTGTMEIVFGSTLGMTEDEINKKAQEMKLEEIKAGKRGENKELAMIDPSYAENLSLFAYVVGNPIDRKSDAMTQYLAIQKYNLYRADMNINQPENTRRMIRAFDDDEDALMLEQPMMPQGEEVGAQMPQEMINLKRNLQPA